MYQEFAAVYDRFMDDFDYPAWADYYLEILKRQGYGGGEIWFDDVLIRKDGRFLLPELECLNPENLK